MIVSGVLSVDEHNVSPVDGLTTLDSLVIGIKEGSVKSSDAHFRLEKCAFVACEGMSLTNGLRVAISNSVRNVD